MSIQFPDISSVFDILANKAVVYQYEVLLYERTVVKYQLRLRIKLADGSVLHVNDYISAVKRKYAYQWQRADATWLLRWDNAPYFRDIATFPHHLHDYRSAVETVMESYNITLADVLDYIGHQLNPVTK